MNEQQLHEIALQVREHATGLKIMTQEDYQAAGEFLKQIKSNIKTINGFFAEMKANAYAAWKAICDKENSFVKPMQEAEAKVKKEMAAYISEQERIQREKEAELRKQQEELARKQAEAAAALEKEGKTDEANAVLNMAIQVENLNPVIETAKPKIDGVSYQIDWIVEIIDESQVPVTVVGAVIRPIDLAAVKKLVKATGGKINIPGIKITETKQMKVRAS